ncbi:MAG: hypothetical protein V4629_06730, partial [Pseudomonadota bacterium]
MFHQLEHSSLKKINSIQQWIQIIPRWMKKCVHLLLDEIIIFLSLWTAIQVVQKLESAFFISHPLKLIVATMVFSVLCLRAWKIDARVLRYIDYRDLASFFQVGLCLSGFVAILGRLLTEIFWLEVSMIFFVIFIVSMIAMKLTLASVFLVKGRDRQEKSILISKGKGVSAFIEEVSHHTKFNIIATVDIDQQFEGAMIRGIPIVSLHAVNDIVHEYPNVEIIIDDARLTGAQIDCVNNMRQIEKWSDNLPVFWNSLSRQGQMDEWIEDQIKRHFEIPDQQVELLLDNDLAAKDWLQLKDASVFLTLSADIYGSGLALTLLRVSVRTLVIAAPDEILLNRFREQCLNVFGVLPDYVHWVIGRFHHPEWFEKI